MKNSRKNTEDVEGENEVPKFKKEIILPSVQEDHLEDLITPRQTGDPSERSKSFMREIEARRREMQNEKPEVVETN